MNPRRREFLAGTGTAAALLLAGCGSGGDGSNGGTPTPSDPVPNLDITRLSREIQDDAVVVTVEVTNTGDESSTATLVVSVSAGDQSVEKEQQVSLDPGTKQSYSLSFGVDTAAFREDGSISRRWKT